MGLVGLLALGSGCGGEDTCFTEYNCGAGRRCELGPNFTEGVCVPCDPAEIPYDGLDNDCRPNTLDDDLDGDGDNSSSSRANPGTDCDDNDPEVSGNVAETKRGSDDSLCRDGKDNDCDKVVDELDCADLTRPAVGFLTPTNGLGLSGRYLVQVSASDRPNETGVREVRLEVVGRGVLGTRMSPPYDFEIDTTQIPDGVIVLRATAVDGALRQGSAEISVYVDNYSGPRITLTLPSAGERRGGVLPIVAEAVDAVGVFDFAVEDQGMTLSRAQGGVLDVDLDTRMLRWPDGPRTLTLVARDNNGAETRLALPLEIDNTPPTLTLAPMAGGAPLTGSVELVATAAANDDIAWVDVAGRRTMGPGSGSLVGRARVDTLTLRNGRWVVTATAADTTPVSRTEVGNRGTLRRTYEVYNLENEPVTYLWSGIQPGGDVYGQSLVRVGARTGNLISSMVLSINGRFARQSVLFSGAIREMFIDIVHNFDFEPEDTQIRVDIIDGRGRTASEVIRVRALRTTVPVEGPVLLPVPTNRIGAIADVDGDGFEDLVSGAGVLSVRMGLPDGTFEGPREAFDRVSQALVNGPVLVEELTGDRLLDIIAINDGDLVVAQQVDVRRGTWVFELLGSLISDAITVDGDSDGDLDIVAAQRSAGLVMFRNLGNGNFDAPLLLPQGGGGIRTLTPGDLDGDGDVDFVGVGPGVITTFRMDSGGFVRASSANLQQEVTSRPLIVRRAGGARPYVAVARCFEALVTRRVSAAPVQADGSLGAFVPVVEDLEPCWDGATVDLDADGNDELVMVGENRTSQVFDVSGARPPRPLLPVQLTTRDLLFSDFDDDGQLDLVATVDDTVGFFMNWGSQFAGPVPVRISSDALGLTTWTQPRGTAGVPSFLRVVGGSQVELIGYVGGAFSVLSTVDVGLTTAYLRAVWTSPGTVFAVAANAAQSAILELEPGGRAVVLERHDVGGLPAIADFDGDSRLDAAWCAFGVDSNGFAGAVLRREASGSVIQRLPAAAACNASFAGDFEQDGRSEFMTTSRTRATPWDLSGPAPVQLSPAVDNSPAGHGIRIVEPIFGPRTAPVAIAPDRLGTWVWSSSPRGLVAGQDLPVPSIHAGVPRVVADTNFDGLPDFLSSVGLDQCLQTPAGTFPACGRLGSRLGAQSIVSVGDYTGDGIADVVGVVYEPAARMVFQAGR